MLLDHHRAKLVACGLALETWSRARLHSGSVDEVRELLGYGGAGTGLVIPYDDHYARVRIDNPGPDGKRYRSPRGEGNRLYVPSILEPSVLADPTRLLYVTEGELKALKATQETFPCIALPGVWSWKAKVHGKSLPIADLDRVSWKGRRSIIVFDSDLTEKPPVAWAEHELVKELRHRGADVYLLRLPEGPKVTATEGWSDVPTCIEQGLAIPQYEQPRTVWLPGKVTSEQAGYYVDLMKKVQATAEWKDYIEKSSQVDTFLTGEAFDIFIKQDVERVKQVAAEQGWLVK